MEGRVVLLNGDMVAVRLTDSTYSVFRLNKPLPVEIGDSFLGCFVTTGPHLLLHSRTQQWVDVKIKLAKNQVAARTKRYIGNL